MILNPVLYRRRLIPNECILLKDDVILSCTDNIILTEWNALRPKKDLHHGFSAYFLNEHVKVSKFCKEDGTFMYWYCDIVDYEVEESAGTVASIDLCVDVVVYPDGHLKVLDLDELVQAKREGLLTQSQLEQALLATGDLLDDIYHDCFHQKYTGMFPS